MAHTDKLNMQIMDTIADQIGVLYPVLVDNEGEALQQQTAELAETFAVWFIGVDEIQKEDADIEDIAHDTGRWHMQVRIDGSPTLAARSAPADVGSEEWNVTQLITGDLAKMVDETIDWIDQQVTSDALVRFLEIPAFHITALWLVGESENCVVIVCLPSTYRSIERFHLYSTKDFLSLLRNEQPVTGLQI